jgi:3'-phosphoadenosine 5'-phosphosulfate (PAPS) 3'-phosphatase
LGSCRPWNIPVDETTLFSKESEELDTIHDETTPRVTLFVGDTDHVILVQATHHALDISKTMTPSHFGIPTTCPRGGTASKMMAVSQTPYSMAILHFKTCLWDTCATEAVVHARGGMVTDLFGRPLVHSPDSTVGNIYGVVVSSRDPIMRHIHDRLCSDMRKDEEEILKILSTTSMQK